MLPRLELQELSTKHKKQLEDTQRANFMRPAQKKKETTERTRHILKQKEQCSEEVGWKRSNNQGILGSALRDTGQDSRSLWILRRGFFFAREDFTTQGFRIGVEDLLCVRR